MRAALGIAAVTALIAAGGLGVLAALGVVRRGAALRALGLAYMLGVALVTLVGVACLTLGLGFRLPALAIVCCVLALGGAAVGRRRGHVLRAPAPGGPAAPRGHRRLLALLAALGGAYLLLWLLTFAGIPFHVWDSWSIWGRKAMILYRFDGLPRDFFVSHAYAFMHQDYPLALPLLESLYLRGIGHVDPAALNAVFWLLLAGFAGAVAFVASSFTRAAVWAPVVFALLFAPLVYGQLSTAYADVPLGLMLGLGVLLLARWLEAGRRADLALAAAFLASAANLKNEGVAAALVALVAAGGWLLVRHERGRLVALAAAGAAVAVAIAPWRIWQVHNGVHSDLPLGRGLDPAYLVQRADRVPPAIKALAWGVVKQGGWLVPAAALALALGLAARPTRGLAGFYAATALAVFATAVWSFCITRQSIDYQVATAGQRIGFGTVFVAVAALVHVGARLGARGRDGGAAPGGVP